MKAIIIIIIKVLTLFLRSYLLEDNTDQGPKFHPLRVDNEAIRPHGYHPPHPPYTITHLGFSDIKNQLLSFLLMFIII
jgi:hypothetical protein